jgi:hypothetical protein
MFSLSHGRKTRDGNFEFSAEQLMGPSDDQVVKLINISRNRKTNKWLQEPRTVEVLAVVALLFRIVMECLYEKFDMAAGRQDPSLLTFIDPENGSPARLIGKLFDLVSDLNHAHWVILRRCGSGDWTQSKVELFFLLRDDNIWACPDANDFSVGFVAPPAAASPQPWRQRCRQARYSRRTCEKLPLVSRRVVDRAVFQSRRWANRCQCSDISVSRRCACGSDV